MQSSIFSNLWLPSRIPSKKLMLVMHGRGDSHLGFEWLPKALDLPQLNYRDWLKRKLV